MFTTGQRVTTEYGTGTVAESSPRRVVVTLDNGETLNVITGTFGYERIQPVELVHYVLGHGANCGAENVPLAWSKSRVTCPNC